MLEQHFGKIIFSILLIIILIFVLMFYKSNQSHQQFLQNEINQLKNQSKEQEIKTIRYQQQVLDKQSEINRLKEQKLNQQINKIETVVDDFKDQQQEEKHLREEYVKMSSDALKSSYLAQGLQTASAFKMYVAEYYFSEGSFPNNNKQLNLPTANSYATDYVTGVWVSRGGKITVFYKPRQGQDQGAISLVPSYKNNQLQWKCISRDYKKIQQFIPQCHFKTAN